MKTKACATLLSLALVGAGSLFAVTTATTDPVGFVSVTVPATSDAVLAVPLNRTAEFKGVIQSISGTTITVAGTSPAWTSNQFVQNLPSQTKTYAVLFATGAKEGMTALVTGNGSNSLTIQLSAGDDLSGVLTEAANGAGTGDHIDVVPYWTPAALLTTAPPTDTQIMLFSGTVAGINIATSKSYTYDAGWYDDDTFANADNLALKFGQGFVLRNKAATPMTISMVGSVPMTKSRNLIRTLASNTVQDVVITIGSPIPEKIGNFGVGFGDGDEIQVYNNATSGYNKAPSKIYFYDTGAWYDGDTFANVTTTLDLQPGFGYLFRLHATPSPATFTQSTLPSYLAP